MQSLKPDEKFITPFRIIVWLLEYFLWCQRRLVASAIGKHTDDKGKETCYFDTYIPFFSLPCLKFSTTSQKGTTVSRDRFTPFPSSRSSLEGARSRGARCSKKKRGKRGGKKRKKKEKRRKKKRKKGKKGRKKGFF